jgi:cytochrome P450
MIIYFLLALIPIFFIWLRWHYGYWERLGVEGPIPIYFLGNLWETIKSRHFGQVVKEWYDDHPDVPYIGYYRYMTPGLMIRDPELVKRILMQDFDHFESNDLKFCQKTGGLLAYDPFQTSGGKWIESRRHFTYILCDSKVKQLYPIMQQSCDGMINYLKKISPKDDIDAKDLAEKHIMDNMVACMFSADAKCFEDPDNEYTKMGKILFEPSFRHHLKYIISSYLPLVHTQAVPKEVDRWMRKQMQDIKSYNPNTEVPENLIRSLIDLDGRSVSVEQLVGYAVTLFMTGHQSTHMTTISALYYIAKHEEVQEKLYEAIMSAVKETDDHLTLEALESIEYLEWVINETLRLSPPVMTVHKLCTRDYELIRIPGAMVRDYTIKKGTSILISTYGMHMNEKYWEEPDEFMPERFDEATSSTRPTCAYIPFGYGSRSCSGMQFATVQLKICLVALLRNFEIVLSEKCDPPEVDTNTFIMNTKNAILLNFKSRTED